MQRLSCHKNYQIRGTCDKVDLCPEFTKKKEEVVFVQLDLSSVICLKFNVRLCFIKA